MTRRLLAAGALAALLLAGCGDDGGGGSADPELVDLLREETGQSEVVASCIAEKVEADDRVDGDELEAIIRGDGTEDVDTAAAYGDAAFECAEELVGELSGLPGIPEDLSDQLPG